ASAPRSRDPYPHQFDRQSCCGQCVPSDVNPESPADTHSLSSPDRLQSNNSPYTETDNCSNTNNHSPDAIPTIHRRTALSASSYDGNDKPHRPESVQAAQQYAHSGQTHCKCHLQARQSTRACSSPLAH